MQNGQLVSHDIDPESVERIKQFYAGKMIPAEKKPFLIDLQHSGGPVMAVENGQFILDVASQIASLGLGFNPGVMFGAAQFLEAWTGRTDTRAISYVREALNGLLRKHLQWPQLHMHICNSGAEANEIALGMCYAKRANRGAKRVLAFEGAFHGRMMIALQATWNAKKREPFAWDGYQTSFAPYPSMPCGDDVREPRIPDNWQATWAKGPRGDFVELVQQAFENAKDRGAINDQSETDRGAINDNETERNDDLLLKEEIDALLAVRELLASGDYYAVLIEPMQCEGGDRYSSARFHHGLANLAKSFDVPLVYDEIQTGYGLGGDFFWHNKFDLRDANNVPLHPAHIVTAKKAQVGAVLSHEPCRFVEQFSATSLCRGFIQATMVDQFRPEIDEIEKRTRIELQRLMNRFGEHIFRPRTAGISFAFDFKDPEALQRFVKQRFQHGLLYYPAGTHSARFRFNLSFRGQLLNVAWQQIESALAATLLKDPRDSTPACISVPETASYFAFHTRFIAGKLNSMKVDSLEDPDLENVESFVVGAMAAVGMETAGIKVSLLTPENWSEFRQQVWDLQAEIYEPLRQTPIKKFDSLIEAENSLAIVVTSAGKIMSMAFAAPPVNFPDERGLRGDAFFNDPKTVYMLDLTVLPKYRGRLGRIMKQAICLAAQTQDLHAIQGRNRDRLARGMWAINLSLGSYNTRILPDDYPDEHEHRDCLMYRCDLTWEDGPLNLSRGIAQPLDVEYLSTEYCQSQLPAIVNKLTLSNFVTELFLEQLRDVFQLLPQRLQHGYSASGMSECVDKLVKTIWLKRAPRRKMIVVGDGFFGHGSFLSRTLSGCEDSLFEATRIFNRDSAKMLIELEHQISDDQALAVFVEPLSAHTGEIMPEKLLRDISLLCRKHSVPLVSHDSGGMFHRYSSDAFLPSALSGFEPDAGMIFLGGQMAVCFMSENYFVETPLMFISTWDGDAFSLAQFHRSMMVNQSRDGSAIFELYHKALIDRLASGGVTEYSLHRGCGWFRGPVETELADLFDRTSDGRFISCPNPASAKRFLTLFN